MRANSEDRVTVVTGVPRSGTSLVMQMLAAGGLSVVSDGVRRADADNPRGYFEFEPVKRLARDAAWVPDLAGRALKVVHTLIPSLPRDVRYRVLLVRRSLDEVLASQRVMLARRGPAPEAAEDLRLRPVLAAQLRELEHWLAVRGDLDWLAVEHAELIADPERAAARIDAFLGGGLDVSAMAACVDPALYRQRRPEASPPASGDARRSDPACGP